MKLISLKIDAAESDRDILDVTFFSVFDLPGAGVFRPIIITSALGALVTGLQENITLIFGSLLDLECRVTGDELKDWKFELVYFLAGVGDHQPRIVRVTKTPLVDQTQILPDGGGYIDLLTPTYRFDYTYDIELPGAGRKWEKGSIADREDFFLPHYEYGDKCDLTEALEFTRRYLHPNTLLSIESNPPANHAQQCLAFIESGASWLNRELLVFTTSPLIVADVDRESVFILSTDSEGRTIARNPDFQTFGCDPTIILAKVFAIRPMSGRAATKMLQLMESTDPAEILRSMDLFGDSVEKAYLFDRYRQLLGPDN